MAARPRRPSPSPSPAPTTRPSSPRASRATTPARSRKTTSSPPAAGWTSPTRMPARLRSSPRPTSRAITASSRSTPTATGSTNSTTTIPRSRPWAWAKLTETFEVVTADGTKGTVTVTINGTNDAPVISGQASGEVTDGGNTSATGQLGKTDVDVNDTHTWSVSNDGKGKYGTFTVDQTGKWTYNLIPPTRPSGTEDRRVHHRDLHRLRG